MSNSGEKKVVLGKVHFSVQLYIKKLKNSILIFGKWKFFNTYKEKGFSSYRLNNITEMW